MHIQKYHKNFVVMSTGLSVSPNNANKLIVFLFTLFMSYKFGSIYLCGDGDTSSYPDTLSVNIVL